MRGKGVEVSIQKDQGCGSEASGGQQSGVHLAGSNDEGVETVREHLLDLLHLEERIFLRRGDDEEVTLFAENEGKTFGDVGEEGMHEIRHDEAYEERSTGNEAACGQVRTIAEFFYAFLDTLAGLDTDVRVVA